MASGYPRTPGGTVTQTQPAAAAGQQGKIKVTAPAQAGEDGAQGTPQTAQEMLNGILRPGMPGSPAQTSDYTE